LDAAAPALQEGDGMARFATRSSIQFCTSSDSHATLQAPSRTRMGNWPVASNRAICAKLYGTPKTVLNSFFETSFCVIGHSLRKGSIAMLARNQLAGSLRVGEPDTAYNRNVDAIPVADGQHQRCGTALAPKTT
jgi:hypothetical protein